MLVTYAPARRARYSQIISPHFPFTPSFPLVPPSFPGFPDSSSRIISIALPCFGPSVLFAPDPTYQGSSGPFSLLSGKKGGEDKSLIMVARPHPTWGHELNFLQTPTFYLTAELGFTFYHLVGWTLDTGHKCLSFGKQNGRFWGVKPLTGVWGEQSASFNVRK